MNKQITLIIDAQTFERLHAISANQGGRSVSSVIREILAGHVLDSKRQQIFDPDRAIRAAASTGRDG